MKCFNIKWAGILYTKQLKSIVASVFPLEGFERRPQSFSLCEFLFFYLDFYLWEIKYASYFYVLFIDFLIVYRKLYFPQLSSLS